MSVGFAEAESQPLPLDRYVSTVTIAAAIRDTQRSDLLTNVYCLMRVSHRVRSAQKTTALQWGCPLAPGRVLPGDPMPGGVLEISDSALLYEPPQPFGRF